MRTIGGQTLWSCADEFAAVLFSESVQLSGETVVARTRGSWDVMVIGTHEAKRHRPFHIELDVTCDVPHRHAEKIADYAVICRKILLFDFAEPAGQLFLACWSSPLCPPASSLALKLRS